MTSLLANRITTLVRAPMAVVAAGGRRPLRIPPRGEVVEEDRITGLSCSARASSSPSSVDVARVVQPAWRKEEEEETTAAMVVIVGATGTGKTKLSVDAALALGGEVVNADKIQLYAGLDITTNKVSLADRRGVPHHLLGAVRPDAGELPPSAFRSLAAATAASIAARRRVPVVAGGSNSLIHALLARRFDRRGASEDPFSFSAAAAYRPALRFPCCLLWVDVEEPLLAEYLDRRVDDMVQGGMVEELREYFAATTPGERAAQAAGLGKAIGVAELGDHFAGRTSFRAAIDGIKANTRDLAVAQVSKIRRMADAWGWPVQRLDASAAVRARLDDGGAGGPDAESSCWERDVRGPGLAAIRRFLADQTPRERDINADEEEEEETEALRLLPRMQCCDVVG